MVIAARRRGALRGRGPAILITAGCDGAVNQMPYRRRLAVARVKRMNAVYDRAESVGADVVWSEPRSSTALLPFPKHPRADCPCNVLCAGGQSMANVAAD